MVKIRQNRPQKEGGSSTGSSNIVQLLTSFVLGGMTVFLYLDQCDNGITVATNDMSAALAKAASGGDDPCPTTIDNHQKKEGQSSLETINHPAGWNPIHVFFGEESGIGADPDQEWFAQVHQDEILVDLIGMNGYFIDLAANAAVRISNTFALERKGWNGLCIEPNPVYWYGLSHRNCTVVGALVGGEKAKVTVKLRGEYGGILGRYDSKLANRKKEPDAPEEERYTAPIKQILETYSVPKVIDYMSLDVEGAELMIMEKFPFEDYTIKVMTIERPNRNLKALLAKNGYLFMKKLAWWGETLWAHESTGYIPDHPKIVKIKMEERK